ncbi:MAG: phosphatase [Pseudanabaena sp.]|nr:MAG: phosphatase [Pseudanabaena sp.]
MAEILDFLWISDQIATSGQPTVDQFRLIADAGYEVVINLALPTSDGAIANESEVVQMLGMEYVAIPVIWESPTVENLNQFLLVMDSRQNNRIYVHCAKNMRVSAFIYIYRCLRLHCPKEQAIADLHRIWQPNEIWQKFINDVT